MVRDSDKNGVSGTGHVADVVVFDNGKAVVHWYGDFSSTAMHNSFENVKKIHGHAGTRFVEVDLAKRAGILMTSMCANQSCARYHRQIQRLYEFVDGHTEPQDTTCECGLMNYNIRREITFVPKLEFEGMTPA